MALNTLLMTIRAVLLVKFQVTRVSYLIFSYKTLAPVHTYLWYSLKNLCFTVLISLFNFQNFGNKQPAKIQLFILRISQKTSYWEFMEQTKLNLATVWCFVRKIYGKWELTITDTSNWPTLQLRSFWQQHLQTPLKLTKVCKL